MPEPSPPHNESPPNASIAGSVTGTIHPMHPGWLRCERTAGWIVNAIVLPVALIAL